MPDLKRFQLHDLQMPDHKIFAFLDHQLLNKSFQQSRDPRTKRNPLLVFGSDWSRNPFIISTHLRWNIGLIEKSFYDKHPHDGWIQQPGSSCNGSILRSFWLQIQCFCFLKSNHVQQMHFLSLLQVYDHITRRLWNEKWHNLSSQTLMFHGVQVPTPSLPPPPKKEINL